MGSAIENMFSGGASSGAQQASGDISAENQQNQSNFGPWIQAGQNALSQYQKMLGQGINPQDFYSKMMAGYTESPEAKYAQQQGVNQANMAGAASGMLGSGAEQTALQRQGQEITGQDQDNWFNRMAGIFGNALKGYGDLSGQGLQASGGEGQIGSQLAGDQAQADMASQIAKQSGKNSAIGAGGNMLAHGIGSYFSGGAL